MITDLVVVGARKLVLKIFQSWPKEPPVASLPSQRAEEPVMVLQNAAQVEAVTPLKVMLPVTPRLVEVALVEVELPVMFKSPVTVEEAVEM